MNAATAEVLAQPVSEVRRREQPVLFVAFLTIVGTLLLEIWRPYFYLTDDNLSGFLPGITEFCQKLWSGQWPFINDHVWGGGYNLLADPSGLSVFSPWILLFSWVALTPFYYALADLVSLCNSLAIACSFCWSAVWLRRHFQLVTPTWLIIALSLSYTFTPYNFILGSSWIGFLNGQASFPLIVVGFFCRSHGRAIALQAGALLYALFGGHAHTFVVLCLFSGFASLAISIGQRDARPALRLIGAGVLAGLVTLPFLLPALGGFQDSPRAAGLAIEEASASRIPLFPLALSWVFGPAAALFIGGIRMHGADPVFNLTIAFSLANLPMLAALLFVRRFNAITVSLLLCFALSALFVMRPFWLASLISHLPLLKSLQWPFREIWIMHVASHLFLVVAYREVAPKVQKSTWAVATAVFAGVFLNTSPTFYLFDLDRTLVLSGSAQKYWQRLVSENGLPPHVIVSIDPRFVLRGRDEIPFTLLGTYSFGSLFGFVTEAGYTFTVSVSKDSAGPRPYFFAGAFTPADAREAMKAHPNAWLVELTGLRPATWTITSAGRERRFVLNPETDTASEITTAGPIMPAGESK